MEKQQLTPRVTTIEWVFDMSMAVWVDRDTGDEHRDPPSLPPQPKGPINVLLDEWAASGDPIETIDGFALDFLLIAEGMRSCCAACAREANGEDGS